MATVEELQAELAKRDEQIRGLSTKFQAHERFVKDLGDSVERDAWGNPISMRQPTVAPAAPINNGHPFSAVFDDPSVADSWLKQSVEGLFKAQGFVTNQQMETLIKQAQNGAYQMARGDAMLWRNFDRMVGREKIGKDNKPYKPYADLANYESPFAKRTAKILQEKGLGQPMNEKAAGFDTDWRYQDMKSLELAADLARLDMANEAPAAEASAAAAASAGAAAALSGAPGTGAGVGAGAGKPDFASMATPEEITAALDAATPV